MTHPLAPPTPQGAHGRAWRRLLVAVLAVVTLTSGTGCGLRLETDPPEPLVPDQVEQVRQRATADAVALEVLAGQVASATTDPVALGLLDQVRTAGTEHLTALGGTYRPTQTPEPAEGSAADASAPATGAGPTASAEPTPVVSVTGTDVVALLTETAASARADAAAVPDGRLARVLASVAVARLLLADALGQALVLEAGTPLAEEFEVPPDPPAGLSTQDLVVLVQSEDAVGLTWEVVAARRSDQERDQAAERAVRHRQRAEAWARAAGISATGSDPRRSAYDLPDEVTDAAAEPAATTAALAALEGDLAATYASLVATADAGARSPLVDAVLDASRVQTGLTGVVPLFPGLPERATPAQG